MPVFEDIERSDASPGRHGEGFGRFLDRVAGEYWDAIRQVVNDWFERYCPEEQPDPGARLRASDDRQFHAAFFELYLHESLLRGGYEVSCHPPVPGTNRRPDFLAESPDGTFYLEARSVSAKDAEVVRANRRNQVYDAIEKTRSPNFFLWLDVDQDGPTNPRIAPLRVALEDWLSALDPDRVSANIKKNRVDELPSMAWEGDGWRLTFRAMPKSTEARGQRTGSRPIGVYGPVKGTWVDDTTPLRAALSDKGKAYGTFHRAYVIALNTQTLTSDNFDVLNALYGREQLQIGTTASGEMVTRSVRAPDGYWYGGTSWRHTSVSAVLMCKNVHPGTIGSHIPTLWHHPEPDIPIAEPLPLWQQVAAHTDDLREVPATVPPHEFFGLSEPWPPGERFP